jgi:hypothetical protein
MAFEALFLAVEYTRRSSTSALPDAPVIEADRRWPTAALLKFLRRRRRSAAVDACEGDAAGVPSDPAVAIGCRTDGQQPSR